MAGEVVHLVLDPADERVFVGVLAVLVQVLVAVLVAVLGQVLVGLGQSIAVLSMSARVLSTRRCP